MWYEKKNTVGSVVLFVIMSFVVILTIYPFIYMISVSLSGALYVMKNEIFLFPKEINFDMYKFVLKDPIIFTAYKNTFLYVTIGTLISLMLTSTAAYALSKSKRLIFCRQFNIMIIITMFFNGGMIPSFLVVRNLGMIDTIWGMVLPAAVSAYNLIIMRSFFYSFPTEIEDSGHIDGLNDFGTFCRLVLPTSKAVLASIGLFYAVGLWNSFFLPYVYMTSPSKYPLQVVLRNIVLQGTSDQSVTPMQDTVIVEDSLKFATIVISIIPIIAVYPFIQKYFVKGVMIGSVKG